MIWTVLTRTAFYIFFIFSTTFSVCAFGKHQVSAFEKQCAAILSRTEFKHGPIDYDRSYNFNQALAEVKARLPDFVWDKKTSTFSQTRSEETLQVLSQIVNRVKKRSRNNQSVALADDLTSRIESGVNDRHLGMEWIQSVYSPALALLHEEIDGLRFPQLYDNSFIQVVKSFSHLTKAQPHFYPAVQSIDIFDLVLQYAAGEFAVGLLLKKEAKWDGRNQHSGFFPMHDRDHAQNLLYFYTAQLEQVPPSLRIQTLKDQYNLIGNVALIALQQKTPLARKLAVIALFDLIHERPALWVLCKNSSRTNQRWQYDRQLLDERIKSGFYVEMILGEYTQNDLLTAVSDVGRNLLTLGRNKHPLVFDFLKEIRP